MDASSWTSSDSTMSLDMLDFETGGKGVMELSTQVMTPPASSSCTPANDKQTSGPTSPNPENTQSGSGNTYISVSTTFYPGAENDSLPTDLIILTADSVFFYVHTHRLLAASENGFNHLLPVLVPSLSAVARSEAGVGASALARVSSSSSISGGGGSGGGSTSGGSPPAAGSKDGGDGATASSAPDPIITLPESSILMNIVLHTIYGMSCSHYSPTFDDLADSVRSLVTYGISLQRYVAPSTPLFNTLLEHAPTNAMALYTLAATHTLHPLAVASSPHLLSFSLPYLTDELATQLGGFYTKKLFFLHLGRTDALKRLLLPPPQQHAPTMDCDLGEQKKLTRAWALASAYLTWDARPDMKAGMMESALSPLGEHLGCEICKESLRARIRDLVMEWGQVKMTI